MAVGSHYSMNRLDYNKDTATLADLGLDTDREVVEYDVNKWDLEDFIEAWILNQNHKEWGEFYPAMALACFDATGSICPPLKLQARLNTCARHLTELKAAVPAYPDRPVKVKKTLEDVLKGRLAQQLAGSAG